MVEHSLFLGCLIPHLLPGIESAARYALPRLGVELKDVPGASCCPAPGVVRSYDQRAWLLLAARNLALARRQGPELLTLCSGCFSSLAEAAHLVEKNNGLREEVNRELAGAGLEYEGGLRVRHFAEVMVDDVGADSLRKAVVRPIHADVALHYGCHLLKPKRLTGLGPTEYPGFLEPLMEALGATVHDYAESNLCCGAGGGVRSGYQPESIEMAKLKVESINAGGARLIVNVCPFCHIQLGAGVNAAGLDLSVAHLIQVMAVAMGAEPELVGLKDELFPNEK